MKLVIIGSGNILIDLINELNSNFKEIEVTFVCNLSHRKAVMDNTQVELDKIGVKTIDIDVKKFKEADLVLSFNCSAILPTDVVNSVHIINMHVGILPKYRGNSANTWAIMNGESYVGFTIHKMVEMLDAGDIYFVSKIPIGKRQTYSEVYDDLMNSIVKDTPKVLMDIYTGNLTAKKQEGDFLYCTLFSKEIGYIKNFDIDTEYIFNLYRCMSRPHGSGIYFYKNGVVYETRKVIAGYDIGVCNYIGIPGKVVNVFNDMIWIKTRDNIVAFGDIFDENGVKVNVNNTFKNGNALG